MNGSTAVAVDFGETGARDGIHEYCQDVDVSASEELRKLCGSGESRSAEKNCNLRSNAFSASFEVASKSLSQKSRTDRRILIAGCHFSASVVEYFKGSIQHYETSGCSSELLNVLKDLPSPRAARA
jgi:hypothetical protein